MHYSKIALAVAFSPRIEALIAEAARLKNLLQAELILIHVGARGEKEEVLLNQYLTTVGLAGKEDVKIVWEKGDPSKRILATCKKLNVDMLIAGALRKENLLQYYLGTVARKILRKADCSVLMLISPETQPKPFKNIVVNAEDSPFVKEALETACRLGTTEKAHWLHVVREIKLYGLTMSAAQQSSEEEYEDFRTGLVKEEIEKVERLMKPIPCEDLKINIKLLSGKSGFEVARFAHRKHADLLIVGAPPRRFSLIDRFFPHDLEYIFADMPCNLLIVHPSKSEGKQRKEASGE